MTRYDKLTFNMLLNLFFFLLITSKYVERREIIATIFKDAS